MKHATRWLMACIGGLTLCAAAPISLGQPDGPRPADEAPRGEGAPDEAVRRERARQLITERLKRLEDNQKLLRESLDMLDRGESLDAVREHGRAALGERAERFREGGPRMGGPGNLGPPEAPEAPMARENPADPGRAVGAAVDTENGAAGTSSRLTVPEAWATGPKDAVDHASAIR